jgi:hypothetical protein
VTTAHPTKFVPMNSIRYPIFVRTGEILAILIENGFFYNRIRTKPIEALKRNHLSGFKTILISYSAKKFVAIDLYVAILVKLLSRTFFHNVINTKFVPLDLNRDPPKPLGGAICVTCSTLF